MARTRREPRRKKDAGERGGALVPPQQEAKPDERLVDRAVVHLRKLMVVGQVEIAAEAGEYVIEHFYDGVENARSRNPRKPMSLARLGERAPEFGMTYASLRYVVPTALAIRDLGASLSGRMGLSRLREILPLQDTNQRRLVAETSVASGWTVREVRQRVRKIAEPHPGGRPAAPALARAVGRIASVVEREAGDAAGLRAGLEDLTLRDARELLSQVNRAQTELERMEKLLQQVLGKRGPGRAEGGERGDGG